MSELLYDGIPIDKLTKDELVCAIEQLYQSYLGRGKTIDEICDLFINTKEAKVGK